MIKKTLTFFGILLLMHIAHIFEEIIGKAYFIETIYGGLANFVAIMLLLFALPLILFYYVAKNKRLAYQLSFIYTGIMIIDGLEHIAEFVLYKKYFYGSAGLFTGIGLIIIGIPLIYYIKKEMPNRLIHRKKEKYAIVGTKIILIILMLFLPMVVSININADLSDMQITGFLLEGFSEKTLGFIESGGALLTGIVLLYFHRKYFSAQASHN